MTCYGRQALLLLVLVRAHALAGEIPGLPTSLPPHVERNLELVLSNDFFGSGGSVDDFRTQQIILAFKPTPRWSMLFDHSVLTYYDPQQPGRIDQMTASFGYDVIRENDAGRDTRVTFGTGFRTSGDYAGERIQNGFHRLIDNALVVRPHTGFSATSATAWADAEHYTTWRAAGDDHWRWGSWWRVNSLLTSDAEWDSSAALYAVASRRSLDVWLGLRRDWRSGYDHPVFRETAAAEDDMAVVFGLRFGALIIETVQQLNNEASYGQVRLVSSGKNSRRGAAGAPRFGIEVGFLLPDLQLHVAGRTPSSFLASRHSTWHESVFVSVDYGEPQHHDNRSVFIRSTQLGLGLEWERPLSWQNGWLSAYASTGLGYREERLVGDVRRTGQRSAAAGSAVLLGGTGVRVDVSKLGLQWNLRMQLGVTARLPASQTNLEISGLTLAVQEAALDAMFGMTFDFN